MKEKSRFYLSCVELMLFANPTRMNIPLAIRMCTSKGAAIMRLRGLQRAGFARFTGKSTMVLTERGLLYKRRRAKVLITEGDSNVQE